MRGDSALLPLTKFSGSNHVKYAIEENTWYKYYDDVDPENPGALDSKVGSQRGESHCYSSTNDSRSIKEKKILSSIKNILKNLKIF